MRPIVPVLGSLLCEGERVVSPTEQLGDCGSASVFFDSCLNARKVALCGIEGRVLGVLLMQGLRPIRAPGI